MSEEDLEWIGEQLELATKNWEYIVEDEVNESFNQAYVDEHNHDEPDDEDLGEIRKWGWFQYEGVPDEDELWPPFHVGFTPEDIENILLEKEIESIKLGYRYCISGEKLTARKLCATGINKILDEAYTKDNKFLNLSSEELRRLEWFKDE